MLQIKHFKATDYEKANDFIKKNGARAQNGCHLIGENIYIFYDDGLMSKGRALNIVNEIMSDQKAQIISHAEGINLWRGELAKVQAIKDDPKKFDMLPPYEQKKLSKSIEEINVHLGKEEIQLNHCEKKIASCVETIKQIKAGNFID